MNGLWMRHAVIVVALAGWALLLLAGMYVQPLQLVHDVGGRVETMSGLYPPEHNSALSYAYTTGDALLRLPQLGGGAFVVAVRMAGPGTTVALPTRLQFNTQQVDAGPVQQLRTYHVLVPSDGQSGIAVRLLSDPVTLPGEPRALGVLLDRIELRSTAPTLPSSGLAASLLAILAVAGWALQRRAVAEHRIWGALLLLGTLLALAGGAGRGRVDLLSWWGVLGAALCAAVLLWCSRHERHVLERPWRAVGAVFLAWHGMLWCVVVVAQRYGAVLRPLEERIEHQTSDLLRGNVLFDTLVGSWVFWDSRAYLSIATDGYSFAGQRWPNVAFFPLYPMLITATTWLAGNSVVAAVLVANVAFGAAVLLLYHLLARDFGATVAFRAVLLLLACPTSFFFAAAYSESVALLLLVAAVWFIRQERWWLAGACGALLALARLPGVVVAPIMAFAYLEARGWNWRAVRGSALAVLVPPLGLGVFMLFQWQRFGTPFAFLIAQQSWHNGMSMPWVLPQQLYAHTFLYGHWPMAVFQSLFWLAFIGLTVVGLLRLPRVYALTLLLVLLPPYLSSWPWSISRHVLLGFPAFVVLAWLAKQLWVRQVLLVVMLALLALATVLFANGFLVA